jgi:limonene-1,2-epoxide hydrolase
MNTAEANKALAEKWMKAFNDQNLEELLELYHSQARHFSPRLKQRQPETGGLITGTDQLRAWWRDAFERMPGLKYRLNKLTADESQVFMEYTRVAPGEPDQEVAEVLEIRNGKILFSRVYLG